MTCQRKLQLKIINANYSQTPISHKQHDDNNDMIINFWMKFMVNEYKRPLTKYYKYGLCGRNL